MNAEGPLSIAPPPLPPEAAARLAVLHADALTISGPTDLPVPNAFSQPDGAPVPTPTKLVANLPYNVSVPVLLRMLELFPTWETGLVMVQLEVADRLAAKPGSKVYGVPSAKTAWYAETARVGTVPPKVFWPVPNVDSALVSMTRREPPTTRASRAEVFAVVDAAFAQRRKMLRGALSGLFGSSAGAVDALEAAGVDPQARGEVLGIADFARIAEQVAARR